MSVQLADVGINPGVVHQFTRMSVQFFIRTQAHPTSHGRAQLSGTRLLLVSLLYGARLRLNECLSLRVKDIDLSSSRLLIRQANEVLRPQLLQQRLGLY
jgi:integrase